MVFPYKALSELCQISDRARYGACRIDRYEQQLISAAVPGGAVVIVVNEFVPLLLYPGIVAVVRKDCRVFHSQRLENILSYIICIGLSRDALDDVTCQSRAPVAVGTDFARTVELRRFCRFKRLSQRDDIFLVVDLKIPCAFAPASIVVHEVQHRYGFVVFQILQKTFRQIGPYVGIKVELSLFVQLHRADPDRELADAAPFID